MLLIAFVILHNAYFKANLYYFQRLSVIRLKKLGEPVTTITCTVKSSYKYSQTRQFNCAAGVPVYKHRSGMDFLSMPNSARTGGNIPSLACWYWTSGWQIMSQTITLHGSWIAQISILLLVLISMDSITSQLSLWIKQWGGTGEVQLWWKSKWMLLRVVNNGCF